ncbi:MAG: glycosyl hydrolase 108 family protein [Candidatus Binataceae bacterium]
MDDASKPSPPQTGSYSSEFLAAVSRVLEDEGGTENAPDDPGGITRFGISAREYPTLDIANLTRADAIAIYYRDYWRPFGLDAAPGPIAAKVFDLAVNIGPSHAIGCLQRALRRRSSSYRRRRPGSRNRCRRLCRRAFGPDGGAAFGSGGVLPRDGRARARRASGRRPGISGRMA